METGIRYSSLEGDNIYKKWTRQSILSHYRLKVHSYVIGVDEELIHSIQGDIYLNRIRMFSLPSLSAH